MLRHLLASEKLALERFDQISQFHRMEGDGWNPGLDDMQPALILLSKTGKGTSPQRAFKVGIKQKGKVHLSTVFLVSLCPEEVIVQSGARITREAVGASKVQHAGSHTSLWGRGFPALAWPQHSSDKPVVLSTSSSHCLVGRTETPQINHHFDLSNFHGHPQEFIFLYALMQCLEFLE